jgi:NAD(P)-dependent dehydrogenase (short-subunit alcohol dehydrogenase family)
VELFSLTGKAALVTGASRGIGEAIARAYADAGADVAILARSAADLESLAADIADSGRTAVALPCDVTQPDEIHTAVERAIAELGRIDILVNNAGGPLFNAPFLDIRPDGWRRVIELNLLSVVSFCQEAGAHMVDRGTGSVINIDSIGAKHPAQTVGPYCATKAAVVNLTMTLAQEWGTAGVRVNAVSPGWIHTEINRAVFEHPTRGAVVARGIPLGRWGEPEDVIGVAVWLASDASSYITGAHIPVDGGVSVVAPQAPSGPSSRARTG